MEDQESREQGRESSTLPQTHWVWEASLPAKNPKSSSTIPDPANPDLTRLKDMDLLARIVPPRWVLKWTSLRVATRPGMKKKKEDDDEEIYNISIKDLRARRVFSKPTQLKRVESVGVVQSGMDLNPDLSAEMGDGKMEKFGDESCGGVGKSVEEIRWGEGLLEERCDFPTHLKITSCRNPNLSMFENCELNP